MALVGQDVAAVRQLASLLQQQAQEITSIISKLGPQIENVEWRGQDANQFRNDWKSVHLPHLKKATEALSNASTAAKKNAAEQEKTSSHL